MGKTDFSALQKIIEALTPLEDEERHRLINSALTFLGTTNLGSNEINSTSQKPIILQKFSETEEIEMSPKEFLMHKAPESDVERIACLAYYLTHYMDKPHFKTIDISTLNTEAAQRKFSNASVPMKNAVKRNYLASALKGNRQLSSYGEAFVKALPDREKAKAVMKKFRPRKKSQPKKKK